MMKIPWAPSLNFFSTHTHFPGSELHSFMLTTPDMAPPAWLPSRTTDPSVQPLASHLSWETQQEHHTQAVPHRIPDFPPRPGSSYNHMHCSEMETLPFPSVEADNSEPIPSLQPLPPKGRHLLLKYGWALDILTSKANQVSGSHYLLVEK